LLSSEFNITRRDELVKPYFVLFSVLLKDDAITVQILLNPSDFSHSKPSSASYLGLPTVFVDNFSRLSIAFAKNKNIV